MTMLRILPCGSNAVLAEIDSLNDVMALDAAITEARIDGVIESVPAARSVLVHVDTSVTTTDVVIDRLRQLTPERGEVVDPTAKAAVEIAVSYDGPDLTAVAAHLGVEVAEVISRHTAALWRVAFVGFAPGFPYLVGGGDGLRVPRHARPRTDVPAGSVALADEFCGIYPRPSPGGWQLIGSTRHPLWDPSLDPPAALTPGAVVRFVEVPA